MVEIFDSLIRIPCSHKMGKKEDIYTTICNTLNNKRNSNLKSINAVHYLTDVLIEHFCLFPFH